MNEIKANIIFEIRDLHANPGDTLPKRYTVQKNVFQQEDSSTQTTEFTGEEIDPDVRGFSQSTTKERTKIEPLIAFRMEDDEPIFRLGGAYGKLAGLFKSAAKSLYEQKATGFKSSYKSFIKSIIIKPQWVNLTDASKPEVSTIPQLTAGRSQALILLYYEKIPHCLARLEVQLPDGKDTKKKFEALLEQAEGMPFGPKRRGELRVKNIRWIN